MPIIKTPIHCPVCGSIIDDVAVVVCGHCGSELNFENPEGGSVVKRGSTPEGRKVIEVVVSRFLQSNKVNLAADALAIQRLTEVSELAAREIAIKKKTVINLPFIASGSSGPINLKMKLNPDDLV